MRADSVIAASVGDEGGESTKVSCLPLARKGNSEMGRGLRIKCNSVLAVTVSVGGDGETAVGEHKGFLFAFVSRTRVRDLRKRSPTLTAARRR